MIQSDPIIDEVQENEVKLLSVIAKKTFREAFEAQNHPIDFQLYISKAFSYERLYQEWSNKNTTFYFCHLDGHLVAYFKINQAGAQSEFQKDNGLELERIYVISEYQKQGIGKQLLDYVLKLAKSRKMSYVWLGVWQENLRAIRFYEQNGFQKTGTHPYYIGSDKQTDWLMRKDIMI